MPLSTQNCELVFLRVIHRANRNLLFAVFANFAFAFHTLFAFFAFRAYPKYFIAHSALFALKLLLGRNHAVRSVKHEQSQNQSAKFTSLNARTQ